MNWLTTFAAEEGFHIVLKAEPVFTIGPVTVTNSMILGWVATTAILALLISAARRTRVNPQSKFALVIESLMEFLVKTIEDVTHDRAKALRFAPLIICLFIFILLNNWFGLLPGVGTITVDHDGVAAPVFRAFTADLNGTLALAAVTIILVQIYAIRELGVAGHLKHYFSNQPWNPINLFVGILEVIGEFTKVLSLSLRLFGNIFAGEVLLIVIAAISSYFSPLATLPFIFMELFVGFIQAFVFTMLTIVYLAVATHHEEHDEHGEGREHKAAAAEDSDMQPVPDTI